MRMRLVLAVAVFSSAALLFEAAPVFAQSSTNNGKLHIHVSPKQAYVFVDGKAVHDGSQTIELSTGSHKIGVYNYGYIDKVQDIQIASGEFPGDDEFRLSRISFRRNRRQCGHRHGRGTD